MWIPLPLLELPLGGNSAGNLNLINQLWVHAEWIDRLPRVFQFIFNAPSHHRVHHGMDRIYLDKNCGSIFIIWDRLFGSFQPRRFHPQYGLVKQVDTFNVWTLQPCEYVAIASDWRSAMRLRDRLGCVLGPPGWAPCSAAQAELRPAGYVSVSVTSSQRW